MWARCPLTGIAHIRKHIVLLFKLLQPLPEAEHVLKNKQTHCKKTVFLHNISSIKVNEILCYYTEILTNPITTFKILRIRFYTIQCYRFILCHFHPFSKNLGIKGQGLCTFSMCLGVCRECAVSQHEDAMMDKRALG